MTYTTHGHHIPGSPFSGVRPLKIARCGGVGVCTSCSSEAGLWAMENKPSENKEQGMDLQLQAKIKVVQLYNETSNESYELTTDDVYVVWFAKTLQNWKALVSTVIPDDRYYELTYNGDTKETYIDVYVKMKNVAIPD